MKKLISIIFATTLSLGVFAQNDTMFIHKGHITYELLIAGIDSILFHRAPALGVGLATQTIDPGVIINGVRWATRNVDMPGTFAQNPESWGMFYQWNRNIGWSRTEPRINSNGNDVWDSSTPTGDTWEKANDPCPPGWRVPTREELEALADRDNVTSVWGAVNSVRGRTFTDRATGNSIFLPAVGQRTFIHGNLSDAGWLGSYWSSTSTTNTRNAFSFGFLQNESGDVFAGGSRADAKSVRCVVETGFIRLFD